MEPGGVPIRLSLNTLGYGPSRALLEQRTAEAEFRPSGMKGADMGFHSPGSRLLRAVYTRSTRSPPEAQPIETCRQWFRLGCLTFECPRQGALQIRHYQAFLLSFLILHLGEVQLGWCERVPGRIAELGQVCESIDRRLCHKPRAEVLAEQ